MLLRIQKNLIYVCGALLLAACGTDGTSVVTGISRPSIDPSLVVLYLSPPTQYETIGLVSGESGKHGSDESKMNDAVQKLKEEAADAGANGVVIQNATEEASGSTGVVVPAGNLGLFVSNEHHREIVRGIAIYVSDVSPPSLPAATKAPGSNSAISTDFKAVSANAEEGDPAAQYNLGILYMQGIGTPQNYIEALKWLILVKATAEVNSNIYRRADSSVSTLESQMTSADVAQAQSEASVWFKAHSRH
jgi:TPR repeat protein